MKTLTASQISGVIKADNCDVEFEFDGRLYQLDITQDALTVAYGTHNEVELFWWKNATLSTEDFLEVIVANQELWYDVTECTDRGQALLRRNARRTFLSHIVTTANKMRKALGSLSTALHAAWTKAKILAAGIVNFIKVADFDNEDAPIYSRRIANAGNGKGGLLLFTDLDKYEAAKNAGLSDEVAKAKSFISMHIWQVVSWGTIVPNV